MNVKKLFLLATLLSLYFCFNCQEADKGPQTIKADEVVSSLQKRLIEAKKGEQILLPAGTFSFKRALSFNDTPDVTIKGVGKGKTILSFKEQIEGAEGLIVKNAKNITLEGFTVADSKGDAIKVQACENVIMRDLETTWTGGKKSTNGAYGLYPVSSKNVLMEKCESSYASDAGIYVGQSKNVVIRDNYAHNNVAGIEIENTILGEVYNNVAKNNTAGMLIFDMPDLPQANGDKIKFYDNEMDGNNGKNFAPPGLVVSSLPAGTGMLLMAHSNIEVKNNIIKNHKTSGISITSWIFTGTPYKSKDYDPYCTNIHIHDNVITGTQGPPDMENDFGKLLFALFEGKSFDIIIDGIFKPSSLDENGNPTGFCFKNNGDITFVNLNAGKGATPEAIAQNMDMDLSKFDCEMNGFDTKKHDEWLAAK